MNKNQKGFSAVEALLIFVIAGLLGFVGWYVYDQNKKSDSLKSTDSSTQKTAKSEPKKEAVDTEAQSWQLVTSKQEGFSIRIPDGWIVTNYGQADRIRGNQITYKAGQKTTVEVSDTDYAGDGLVRFEVYYFKNSDDLSCVNGDEEKSSFTVSDMQGAKYYKKYPLEELVGVGPIPGEESYTYELSVSDKTACVVYRILNKNQYSEEYLKTNYNQTASDPNQVQLIERVVKTLVIK